jgi:hypothetical protein
MIQSIHTALWNADISAESTFTISGLRDALTAPPPINKVDATAKVYIGDITLEDYTKLRNGVQRRRIEIFLLHNKTLELGFFTYTDKIAKSILDNGVDALLTTSGLTTEELRDKIVYDILNEFEHTIVRMILDGEITENEFLTGKEECTFDFETRREENVDILVHIRELSEEIDRRLEKGVLTADDDDVVFEMFADVMRLRDNTLPRVDDKDFRTMVKDWLSCSV